MNKIKTIISTILVISIVLLCSNVAIAEEWHNGSVEYDILTTVDEPLLSGVQALINNLDNLEIYFHSEAVTGKPEYIKYTNVRADSAVSWANVPQVVGGFFYYDSLPDYGGEIYFEKTDVTNCVNIILYFHPNMPYTDDTLYTTFVEYSTIDLYYYSFYMDDYPSDQTDFRNLGLAVYPLGYGSSTHYMFAERLGETGECLYTKSGSFRNDFAIHIDGLMGYTELDRTNDCVFTSSSLILKDSSEVSMFDSGYAVTDNTYYHGNYTRRYYIKSEVDELETLIYTSVGMTDLPGSSAGITTDKAVYNYLDEIVFNYTKLDTLESSDEIYDLITYYYDENNEIHVLQTLRLAGGYSTDTGQAWFSTINYPLGHIYYGIIDEDLDYFYDQGVLNANILLSDDIFLISEDGSEYIALNSKKHYYENTDSFTYSYYALSETNITILDNDGTILSETLKVNGYGENTFMVPKDNNKVNEYPEWAILLNSTVYDNFTVYWKEIDTNEINPDYTPSINQTTQENIDELKDGFDPIIDLVTGLTTIFVDNPDYDSNGIVDTEEMSNWFNSLVSMVIILLFYILYKVFTRK